MLLAIGIGVVPRLRALLSPLLNTVAMIPPLAILPVLFIVLGLEETSKIALIVIGVAPCVARDLALRVGELPKEQLIKAQTLGASTWQLVLRVVLPQLWPRLIDALRLSMGSAWLFLIAAEAIASTEGLGYRIFLVRRYLAMDVILPYVVWITLLAVLVGLAAAAAARARISLGGARALMATVSVRNVWKEYGAQVVLENLHLEIADHEFVTIVGASGCGKTTFLKMLLGMEQPTRGQMLIDGEPIRPEPDPDRGIVFQRYSLFPHLTVLENVMLGLELKGAQVRRPAVRRRAARGARRRRSPCSSPSGWRTARDQYPAQLSGGMQQRMSIAQSVICKPKILLLDEPFGALDPGVTADMHELILKLWAENRMTIFMVSHDIQESFSLGTRLLTFDKLRHDPQAPEAYGASVTYDMPLTAPRRHRCAAWRVARDAPEPRACAVQRLAGQPRRTVSLCRSHESTAGSADRRRGARGGGRRDLPARRRARNPAPVDPIAATTGSNRTLTGTQRHRRPRRAFTGTRRCAASSPTRSTMRRARR